MRPDWSPLDAALRACRAAQIDVPLWWRDDDAVAPTTQLDHLTQLATDLQLPVHLAVIPAHATAALSDYVANNDALIPLVHGWAHADHSSAGRKKSEFGEPRADAINDVSKGLTQLQRLFGTQLLPVFVPPWNRVAAEMLPDLVALGYKGISTFGPRPDLFASAGLAQINTHIDPINWRGNRGLIPHDKIIAQVASLLQDRVKGCHDAQEPLGYLTHHLVHDKPLWEFSAAFLKRMLDGGALPVNLRNREFGLA